MRKIILIMLALCVNTKSWSSGMIDLSNKMTLDECKEACSVNKCKTIHGQSTCLTGCAKQVDIQPCMSIRVAPKNPNEANTAAGIKKELLTKQLLGLTPDAAYYLNSGDLKLREAAKAPTPRDYKAVNYVLVNLRAMCAHTISEYLNVSKGKEEGKKNQLLGMMEDLDRIIDKAREPSPPLPGQPIRTNMQLKETVGMAELLVKNCIQQGATATYSFKNQTSQKLKGFFNKIAAPFTCNSCTLTNCAKDLNIYKKCVETCPSKYREKCQNASNQEIRRAYQEHYNEWGKLPIKKAPIN